MLVKSKPSLNDEEITTIPRKTLMVFGKGSGRRKNINGNMGK